MKNERQYIEGHFIGIGISIGLPISVPIGLALGNIAIGFVLGLPLGLCIGIAMEKTLNKNSVPLTQKQKTRLRRWSSIGTSIGLVVILSLILIYFAQ